MNNFSFSRLWLYAKAEFMSSRRLIWLLLGSVLGLLIILYGYGTMRLYHEDGTFSYSTSLAVSLLSFVAVGASILFMSMCFKQYFKKGYSTSTMMMPVSLKEKFTYKLILGHFVVPIALLLLVGIVDLVGSLYFDASPTFIIRTFFRNFNGAVILTSLFAISTFSLFILSMFFYGAVFFRRYQLLMTIVSIFLIWILLSIINNLVLSKLGIGFSAIYRYTEDNWFQVWDTDNYVMVMQSIVGILCTIGVALMWTLSWRRFKKLQITK